MEKKTELFEVKLVWVTEGTVMIEAESEADLKRILDRDWEEMAIPENKRVLEETLTLKEYKRVVKN